VIAAAHQQLHAPLILIWDNLDTHISATMRTFISSHPGWLTEVRLPAYAPDLNPLEGAWANMKNGLGNLAAANVDQLTAIIRTGSSASSTGPRSSTGSSPRPDSPSNPATIRRQGGAHWRRASNFATLRVHRDRDMIAPGAQANPGPLPPKRKRYVRPAAQQNARSKESVLYGVCHSNATRRKKVLGSTFEKPSYPGAPLRNRTVDLLLTMDHCWVS